MNDWEWWFNIWELWLKKFQSGWSLKRTKAISNINRTRFSLCCTIETTPVEQPGRKGVCYVYVKVLRHVYSLSLLVHRNKLRRKEVRGVQRLGFGAWPCSRHSINTVLGPGLMRLEPQGAVLYTLYGHRYAQWRWPALPYKSANGWSAVLLEALWAIYSTSIW